MLQYFAKEQRSPQGKALLKKRRQHKDKASVEEISTYLWLREILSGTQN